jgi:hypothetical protein
MRTLPDLVPCSLPAVATAGPIYGTILFNDAALKGAGIVIAAATNR